MSKMNPEVKAKWLAALRSGEYEQAKEHLKCGTGFCCLGVATDLYIKDAGNGGWVADEDGVERFAYREELEGGVLPRAVMSWMGLEQRNPDVEVPVAEEDQSIFNGPTRRTDIAELNDGGATFLEIADIIEAQL